MTNGVRVRESHSPTQLLARILEAPELAAQVRRLPATVLARLIDHVGLEDAGELVAFASTEQLAQIFDDDVWRNTRPGEDEVFDASRFLLWLRVMLEAGESFVAEKLSELPEEFVVLAFHQQMLVLDLDVLVVELDADDESAAAADKALSSCLYEEIDQYQLVSRHHDGWDDLFAVILALDREHHDLLARILARCCQMTNEVIADNGGLYQVLSSAESLEADVAGEREERRAEVGHVAPSSAAAFLRLAGEPVQESGRDALTRAYFRRRVTPAEATAVAGEEAPMSEASDLVGLLREFGAVETVEAPRLLTSSAGDDAEPAEPLMIRVMRQLSAEGTEAFLARSEEIAYLANVLVAGASIEGRRLRPLEAVNAAVATCSLGLELLAGDERRGDLDAAALDLVRGHGADHLFRLGWSRLQRDVIGAAGTAAQAWLRAAAEAAPDEADRVALLRSAERVRAAAAAGRPWKALGELDALLSQFEPAIVTTLRGLMDECPSLKGTLRCSDARDPLFVTRPSEIVAIRAFLESGGRDSAVGQL